MCVWVCSMRAHIKNRINIINSSKCSVVMAIENFRSIANKRKEKKKRRKTFEPIDSISKLAPLMWQFIYCSIDKKKGKRYRFVIWNILHLSSECERVLFTGSWEPTNKYLPRIFSNFNWLIIWELFRNKSTYERSYRYLETGISGNWCIAYWMLRP